MRTITKVLGLGTAGLMALAVGGCGGGSHGESHGGTAEAGRTIDVTMKDIAYEPTALTVKSGETVKFVFHNEGKIRHDAFLGDEMAQEEHEKEMRGEGGGGMSHDGDAIKVDPGKTGSLTHTFKAGEVLLIGCHEAGHYTAGMKVALTVS
ncbi:MAG: cupredoxin domain-containing protein [Actinobacteria bacterium]|nr:cupredoxin domain-containing protein [Actinomycetota bacterium]